MAHIPYFSDEEHDLNVADYDTISGGTVAPYFDDVDSDDRQREEDSWYSCSQPESNEPIIV